MDDDTLIPDDRIVASSGSPEDVRPGGEPWQSDPSDSEPEVAIDVADEDDGLTELGDLTLEKPENVQRFTIYIQPGPGEDFVPYNPAVLNPTFPAVSIT